MTSCCESQVRAIAACTGQRRAFCSLLYFHVGSVGSASSVDLRNIVQPALSASQLLAWSSVLCTRHLYVSHSPKRTIPLPVCTVCVSVCTHVCASRACLQPGVYSCYQLFPGYSILIESRTPLHLNIYNIPHSIRQLCAPLTVMCSWYLASFLLLVTP